MIQHRRCTRPHQAHRRVLCPHLLLPLFLHLRQSLLHLPIPKFIHMIGVQAEEILGIGFALVNAKGWMYRTFHNAYPSQNSVAKHTRVDRNNFLVHQKFLTLSQLRIFALDIL